MTSVEQARALRINSPHGDSKDLRSDDAWESVGINTSDCDLLEGKGTERNPTMTAFDTADTHTSKRARCALEAPTMISQDDARQDPSGHRMLYVLGFGIAGAILSNMLVFIYFALFYVSA